jgi:hypothetical protein
MASLTIIKYLRSEVNLNSVVLQGHGDASTGKHQSCSPTILIQGQWSSTNTKEQAQCESCRYSQGARETASNWSRFTVNGSMILLVIEKRKRHSGS